VLKVVFWAVQFLLFVIIVLSSQFSRVGSLKILVTVHPTCDCLTIVGLVVAVT